MQPPRNSHFFHHPPTHLSLAVRRSTRVELGLGSNFASTELLDYENATDAVPRGHEKNALHRIALHYATWHYITLLYITLHCITLHCITLHTFTLPDLTLLYIA